MSQWRRERVWWFAYSRLDTVGGVLVLISAAKPAERRCGLDAGRLRAASRLASAACGAPCFRYPSLPPRIVVGITPRKSQSVEGSGLADARSTLRRHSGVIPGALPASPYNPQRLALTLGVCIGPYEIVSAIGAGGMGEVYRATDAKLGRDVALKIVRETVAQDIGKS
jgi:hypothetical protein